MGGLVRLQTIQTLVHGGVRVRAFFSREKKTNSGVVYSSD